MWLECGFENASAGIAMVGNDVPIVASSVFANCGRSVACDGNKALLNSLVRAGPNTEWALPSGGNVGFIEGCEVTTDIVVNASATLFSPGKLPDARDKRSGSTSMIMMGNLFGAMPGGVGVGGPLSASSAGHPTPAAQWYMLNNNFEDEAADSSWSKTATVLVGEGVNSTQAIVLVEAAASKSPQSQLLFGSGW
jgi:hypothetical protein